jgi:hypothetical protein
MIREDLLILTLSVVFAVAFPFSINACKPLVFGCVAANDIAVSPIYESNNSTHS